MKGGRASFRESFAFSLLTFGVLAVLGVGSGIVIARAYGIEVVGAYALAYAPVGLCGTLATMQEQAALVRELAVLPARAPRVTGLFAAVMAFSLALKVVVGAITGVIAAAVLSGPIGRPDLVAPALVLLAEFVVLSNSNWNIDWVFAAFRAGRQLFWIRLAHALVYLGVAVGVSFAVDSVWGLVLAQVGAAAASLSLRIVVVRGFMRLVVGLGELREGMRTFPVMLRFGVKAAPAFVADGATHEAGTWLLGLTASVPAVGAWNRASQLYRRLMDPTYRVAEVLFPTLVERRVRGDREGFDRALLDSTRIVAVGLLLVAAVAGGAADGVMDLYGPGFDQAAPALALLLLVPVFFSITTQLSQALLAEDRPLVVTAVSVGRAVLLVALGVPLALWLGITGMAVALVTCFVADLVARYAVTRRHLATVAGLPWPARTLVATGLAYVAGFGVARVNDAAFDGGLGLLAALLAGTLAFLAVFVLAGGLTGPDRERLAALGDRLPIRRVVRRPRPTPSPATDRP